MKKVLIIYHSEHHGNTKKLVDAIAAAHVVDIVEAGKAEGQDFEAYDAVGFASGIYMSEPHVSISALWEQVSLKGKKAFLVLTSGSGNVRYATESAERLSAGGFDLLGIYHTRGFDTYGPFRLIGGISKGHPTAEETAGAVIFYEQQVLLALEHENGPSL